ncbi:MAG: SDR family oxidoreductase [Ferrovibrio sp.]|jgi:NAD(P)-dependent dehydrogenase (short-subunit alcohol dehydrogenase family)|uniref:SDR family NAD(P)-dependent oxidoreductase n=1 Tax=Ferrovibrio sp. TaxID=1917215 RepID=UPI001B4C03D9|nr:SDR family oxidoreductase [Ferrovibrio sp.]
MNDFDLSGKVALVTGGNGGIGLGMAEGLARAGCDLVIWGGNPEKNAAAEAKLKAYGRRVLVQRCNVVNEAEVEACFAEAVQTMGRIDGCFANAGVSQKRAPMHQLSTEEWKRVLGVNLDGAFYTLRAAARHMVERAKTGDAFGRLVGMASTAGIHGAAGATSYAATKGAMLSVIRALAVEMARYNVTANSILPGWIETEMTAAGVADPRFAGAVLPRIPARRWGQGNDFSGIAVYLMSDGSRYHTGDSFVIDGAYTIF